MVQGQKTINIKGMRLSLDVKNHWIGPKLWKHEKFGIGQMIDATLTGELWVIHLNFGEHGIKKIRQDKLTPYSGQTVFRSGKTVTKKAEEEVLESQEPELPISVLPVRRGSHRELTQEDILKMLRG